jgi:hypothetical protein
VMDRSSSADQVLGGRLGCVVNPARWQLFFYECVLPRIKSQMYRSPVYEYLQQAFVQCSFVEWCTSER